MGNLSGAFPMPRDEDAAVSALPPWTWAVVGAAAAVSLLWIAAIVVLVAFEIVAGRGRQQSAAAGVATHPRLPTLQTHHSLASLPPAIPSPVTYGPRDTPSPHQPDLRQRPSARISSEVGEGEREYNLRVVQNDSDSLCSEASSSSSSSSSSSLSGEAKPVVGVGRGAEGDTASALTTLSSSSSQGSLSGMVLSRPVTVRQLGATLREPGYVESEFRKLPTPMVSARHVPPGAERKNRYSNVLPTPKSRVKLPVLFGRPNSDYINANYIRGHRGAAQQYIATQAPMESTAEDFWRMVWENKSDIVIMATNFQERGIEKCCRYWPAQGCEQYGTLEVSSLQTTSHDDYTTTVLNLRCLATEQERNIYHYRLTCWPQQGVPKATGPVIEFLKKVKMADSCGPAVVHCSAGVGRTAVLLAVDIGLQGILQGDARIDVLRVVSTLRQDRAGLVQTKDQYRFIHQALYDLSREIRMQ